MEIDKWGYRYLLLMIDSFSKFLWGNSYKTKDSVNVSDFLIRTFLLVGFPQILQHDNGGEFVGEFVQKVLEVAKVSKN